MGKLVLVLFWWHHGETLCVTEDLGTIPVDVDTITAHRDVLPADLDPIVRAQVITKRRQWILIHQCPRSEKEI